MLIELLKDEQERKHAMWPLRRVGPPAKAAIPLLEEMLDEDDKWLQMRAAATLWIIDPKSTKAPEALLRCLRDANPSVRSDAAFDTGEVGPIAKSLITELEKLSKDHAFDVSSRASEALEKVKGNKPTFLKSWKW